MVVKYYEKHVCMASVIALFILIPLTLIMIFTFSIVPGLIPVTISEASTHQVSNFISQFKELHIIIVFFILLLLLIIVNFLFFTVKIESGLLSFGFGLIKEKVKLDHIVSCEEIDITSVKNLGGAIYGRMIGIDGSIIYNIGHKKVVCIKVRDSNDYIIPTKNPRKLCELLRCF